MIISSIFRLALGILCFASLLLGLILAALGVWLMYSKDLLRSILNLVDTSSLPAVDKQKSEVESMVNKYDIISTLGLIILILGFVIAGVAVCGWIGASCNIKILLIVYIAVTGSMFAVLFIFVIYFGTFKARMSDKIRSKLLDMQQNYFISLIDVTLKPDSIQAIITLSVNFMHIMLKCCGVESVGDTRSSPSWIASERRIMELAKMAPGVLPAADDAKAKTQSDDAAAVGTEYSGDNMPEWLKEIMPSPGMKFTEKIKLPAKLPPGFKLPPDFKNKLAGMVTGNQLKVVDFSALLNQSLTLQTPITCCKVKNVDELLKGKYDAQKVLESMEDQSCPFSTENKGLNEMTCVDAFLSYISKYQHTVVSVATILTFILGGATFAATWIFCCD